MSQGLLRVPVTSGMSHSMKGASSSAAVQRRELDSQLHDLLGGEEDWDDEEEKEDSREGGGRVEGDHGGSSRAMPASTTQGRAERLATRYIQ